VSRDRLPPPLAPPSAEEGRHFHSSEGSPTADLKVSATYPWCGKQPAHHAGNFRETLTCYRNALSARHKPQPHQVEQFDPVPVAKDALQQPYPSFLSSIHPQRYCRIHGCPGKNCGIRRHFSLFAQPGALLQHAHERPKSPLCRPGPYLLENLPNLVFPFPKQRIEQFLPAREMPVKAPLGYTEGARQLFDAYRLDTASQKRQPRLP
jgi:hypothetical protein